jgi:hypothetical protein
MLLPMVVVTSLVVTSLVVETDWHGWLRLLLLVFLLQWRLLLVHGRLLLLHGRLRLWRLLRLHWRLLLLPGKGRPHLHVLGFQR